MPSPTGFFRTAHELVCDGVSLTAIAAAEGTPVYVYSAARMRERYRAMDEAFGDYPHAIHYALKANSTLAVARRILPPVVIRFMGVSPLAVRGRRRATALAR